MTNRPPMRWRKVKPTYEQPDQVAQLWCGEYHLATIRKDKLHDFLYWQVHAHPDFGISHNCLSGCKTLVNAKKFARSYIDKTREIK